MRYAAKKDELMDFRFERSTVARSPPVRRAVTSSRELDSDNLNGDVIENRSTDDGRLEKLMTEPITGSGYAFLQSGIFCEEFFQMALVKYGIPPPVI
ncbi:hypothetical protein F2P81_006254 [Scophthalmus maximus]|uniref:Uncharacterized protein n=1 Tax=Scophthalmus maximus TaxID=52904 RepID=A0A6A4SYN6_SCOMX|nr:hypothetical protein F2P81_006254 [Scophthalmus maximus]